MPNKFQATWASPSSIGDFINCPRAYYLKNVWKDDSKAKMSTVSPYLTLGSVVHEMLEPLAEIPSEQRKNKKFAPEFFKSWANYAGEKGGFDNDEQEEEFKQRGIAMLKNVKENIQYLEGETHFLMPKRSDLPWLWLSEKEEIILCGKLDWINKDDGYRVLDFKTGQRDEKEGSLQLPIYSILLNHFCKAEKVSAQYWYVARDSAPVEKKLPDVEESKKIILDIALKMKESRAAQKFDCPYGGCFACDDFEKILRGEGKFVGTNIYNAKLYKINK